MLTSNYCEYQLIVRGSINDRAKFKEAVKSTKGNELFDFSGFNLLAQENFSEWVVFEPCVKEFEASINYTFKTVDSKPKPVILTMSKVFPSLKFTLRFWDIESELQGTYTCKKGEVIHNASYEYKNDLSNSEKASEAT